ncbi:MAG: hypothetical protein GY928_05400 [Colwellia sp.]|nr:hypothetical protein [Colwellia sp.]
MNNVIHLVLNRKNCDLCGIALHSIKNWVLTENDFKRKVSGKYVGCVPLIKLEGNSDEQPQL